VCPVGGAGRRVEQRDLPATLQRYLGNPGTHRARADDRQPGSLGRAGSLHGPSVPDMKIGEGMALADPSGCAAG
jgi:hypothetical protein